MTRSGIPHPLLEACGVAHGFGERDSAPPPGVARPRQVHGRAVARVDAAGRVVPEDADAIVGVSPGPAVAIVTADCVPILASALDGAAVAAIHAGWRGLASGVVEAGIAALRQAAPGRTLVAAIGPCIGRCCYEVDAPVVDALRTRGDDALSGALDVTRPGHWRLDLARVAAGQLRAAGLQGASIGVLDHACTFCESARFHSFRRDGDRAGRLLHHVAARSGEG